MRASFPAWMLFGAALAATAQGCAGGWTPPVVDQDPSFPLRGMHTTVTCVECHVTAQTPPRDCEGCHEDARPVPHDQGGCATCHSEDGWSQVVVDHDFFPLQDAHAQPCASCHAAGTFEGLDPACSSCHEADRPAGHNVGQDCVGCHQPTTWGDAEIDHSFFPLQDAHDLSCSSCHAGGTYTGLDPACSSCHEADRPANHHVGQDCGSCHQPTSWGDADFDHGQFFPLPHRGVSACNSCHIGGDTSDFSCTDCHEHSASNTNGHHNEVGGYVYDSDHCYACHPDGQEHD